MRVCDACPIYTDPIRGLLSSLNRMMQTNKGPFSMLEKGDRSFRELHLTLDSVSSDLHRKGVGTAQKSASVVTFEHEELIIMIYFETQYSTTLPIQYRRCL